MRLPKLFVSLAFGICILYSTTALASVEIQSGGTKSFHLYDPPTELYAITITDTEGSPAITAGEIQVTIPDEIAIIFDDERTLSSFRAGGSAVSSNKVKASPAISFADKDKTLIVPIEADFATGEELTLHGIYVEGFNKQTSKSYNLILSVNGETFADTKGFSIQDDDSGVDAVDRYGPEPVTDVELKNTKSGVQISWINPTDLDLKSIQILRGKHPLPIDANPYAQVANGIETFIDTDVKAGDVIDYIIRVSDGVNLSKNSAQFTITFDPNSATAEDDTTVTDSTTTDDTTTTTNDSTDDQSVDSTNSESDDSGATAMTYEQEQATVKEAKIVTQDFAKSTNKCEALSMIANQQNWSADGGFDPKSLTFTDVPDWCALITSIAESAGLVKGHSSSYLGATDAITRYEAAVILVRLAKTNPNLNVDTEIAGQAPYKDQIADWAQSEVNWLYENGLMTGYPDGTFKGNQPIAKIEFAVMLWRLSQL